MPMVSTSACKMHCYSFIARCCTLITSLQWIQIMWIDAEAPKLCTSLKIAQETSKSVYVLPFQSFSLCLLVCNVTRIMSPSFVTELCYQIFGIWSALNRKVRRINPMSLFNWAGYLKAKISYQLITTVTNWLKHHDNPLNGFCTLSHGVNQG